MKKSLFKFTAPALAVGLALSAQGGVSAADNKAEKAEAKESKAQFSQGFAKESKLSHRLIPVEKKLVSVNGNLVELDVELEGKETLTFDEFVEYQEQVDSVFGKLGAATNQLDAVTKKFDDNSAEVIEVEIAISSALEAALLTQANLNSIEVMEEFPEIEEPEVPVEPTLPEEPTEPEPTDPTEPVNP